MLPEETRARGKENQRQIINGDYRGAIYFWKCSYCSYVELRPEKPQPKHVCWLCKLLKGF